MTDKDERTMEKYGITSETKVIFHFQGHRYDRLSDAVNYAKKQHEAPEPAARQNHI
jgi:hypothetical protein